MERVIEMARYLTPYAIDEINTWAADPVPTSGRYNTAVKLTGSLETGTYGSRYFYYNRHNLSFTPTRYIKYIGQRSYYHVLSQINTSAVYVYSVGSGNQTQYRQGYLKRDDIINQPITMPANGDLEFSIYAKDNSFLYTGQLKVILFRS